jgi:hypothetical protein
MTLQHGIHESTVDRTARRPLGRFLSSTVVLAALVFTLAFGAGIPTAAADTPAPQLKSVRVDGTELFFTFVLPSNEDVGGVWLTVRERDNPDHVILDGQGVSLFPLPPPYREISRQAGGMPPDVPVCATLVAWNDPSIGIKDPHSPPSNSLCTDPAKTAKQTDLALQNIRGNIDPKANQSPAYLVEFRNAGGADVTGAVVDVSTSGVAKLADQGAVLGGWAANGFSCAPRGPSGGETAALHCTGGNLKKGEQTDPAVIVSFTGPGFGAIHAQISGAGDTNSGNNGTALNVNVAAP